MSRAQGVGPGKQAPGVPPSPVEAGPSGAHRRAGVGAAPPRPTFVHLPERWVHVTAGPNRAERRARGFRQRLRLGHIADRCPPLQKLVFEPSINKPYRKDAP